MGHTHVPGATSHRTLTTTDVSHVHFRPLPATIITPIDVDRLKGCLRYFPDRQHVEYVLGGLRWGFDLGFRGQVVETRPRNALVTLECQEGVSEAIQKELDRGHTSGPFDHPPFQVTHCSPLGAVLKPDGSVRLILDLSSPRVGGVSINEGISRDEFDQAVDIVRSLGRGCYMAKLDIKHAFRLCPVKQGQWNLLCYCWGEKFYVDTRLPFGGRSSPYIFNSLAQLLCWIFSYVGGVALIIHYLDDFFCANASEEECASDRDRVSDLCGFLGVPLAPEKIIGPAQILTFLGIQIDSLTMSIELPFN